MLSRLTATSRTASYRRAGLCPEAYAATPFGGVCARRYGCEYRARRELGYMNGHNLERVNTGTNELNGRPSSCGYRKPYRRHRFEPERDTGSFPAISARSWAGFADPA